MILSGDEIQNFALAEIEKLLQNLGKTLHDFHGLPYPDNQYFESSENRLITDELCYDRECLAREYLEFISKFTDEQLYVHDTIMSSVHSNDGGKFFVYGYGGTGKTFIWRSLSAGIRSKGDIVLNVASSGIASLLLPGGRTTHSRFKISINVNKDSMCNIKPGGALAELIVRAKLIIWDEAPMIHKYCIEVVDRTLRDIMRVCNELNSNKPFGGKTVVFGGDFRQILPVVPKGSRQDVVNATINSSYLWKSCTVLRLTKNIRLLNVENVDEASKLKEFSSWVAYIGDGVIGGPNDGEVGIRLPRDIVLSNSGDPLRTIVVDEVNQFMISLDQSQGRVYFSSDSILNSDSTSNGLAEIHYVEFLNNLKCSGTPNHELLLKVGTHVMLFRNIDLSNGLCNGTRLIITQLGDYVLEGQVLGGHNIGHKVLIPRMSLIPSDPRLPFKFQRRQFPLAVSYAMTINKSQGQSLSHVGLFLRKPVFNHGQLYVAISRVTSREGLKILVCKDEEDEGNGDSTVNIVYKEVFQNL
ncbi:ATP-dependent DNA helicase pif1-like [Salvia splendens]|uniref:ATP-dependent DNA helicase pif1-like n=1 Tax=Salvia splendens TaxID=180675 RepID=UPI001C278CAB|nr:ATP-dependent DNA helicase pif1-like [Salvia splendens]